MSNKDKKVLNTFRVAGTKFIRNFPLIQHSEPYGARKSLL